MNRRTKVVATVRPASDSEQMLKAMIGAGMDVARLGLAHETLDIAIERYGRIRSVAAAMDRPVGILVDLPGPKVRAGQAPEEGVHMLEGQCIRVVPGVGASDAEAIHVDYDSL